ncbi:MAG: metal-dependent transcriptional regulator [Chitinophagales bacterium]|nr:metal-dependent transcriptional regulator [Chitinophagales bacterium]
MMTTTEENYIKAIFTLSGRERKLVNTNSIATKLQTSAASVTDMLKRLAEKKLIQYEKYKGVKLSKTGEKTALSLIRKHRLWEVFLVDKLNFQWDEVHDIAEQLEHIKSKKLVERLNDYLGEPKFDPHGDPIPDQDGVITYHAQKVLSELNVGDQGIIVGVSDSSTAFLKYLDGIKMSLGSKVNVIERVEYDGSLTIKLNNRKKVLISKVVASNLFVNPS